MQIKLEERKNRSKKAIQGSSKQILKSKSSKQISNSSTSVHNRSLGISNNIRHTNILASGKSETLFAYYNHGNLVLGTVTVVYSRFKDF